MKKLLSTFFFLAIVGLVLSQTTIKNPKYGITSTDYITLNEIELTPEATILSFTVKIPSHSWVAVHEKSYIQPVGDTTKLYLTKAENIDIAKAINWEEGKDKVSYRLFFPKLDANVSRIDFGEPAANAWLIFDIVIKEQATRSVIPAKYLGNWFSPDKGNWAFSFFDSLAIYDNKVWKYASVKKATNGLEVYLKKDNQEKKLFIKSTDKGTCELGLSENELNKYTTDISTLTTFKHKDSKAFETPVLQPGKVVYSGFIKGYTSRYKTTGIIRFSNRLTNEQETYLIKIADDGSFRTEFEIDFPQEISVGLPGANERIFFEPGKDLFQLTNLRIPKYNSLFMGESAEVNFGLHATETVSTDMSTITAGILEMDQAKYVDHILAIKKEELDKLRKFETDQAICAKALQIRKLDIEYRAARNIIGYNQNIREANYYANRNLKEEDQKPYVPKKFDPGLLSKIKDTPINNSDAFISSEYFNLLQSLKYTDLALPQGAYYYLLLTLCSEPEKQKLEITKEEKEALDFVKANLANSYDDNLAKKFNKDYGDLMHKFYQKHTAEFQKIADSYYNKTLSSNLKLIFGSSDGLISEVNTLNNFSRRINDTTQALNEEDFKKVKSEISTDYLKEVAISEYYNKKAKLEANNSPNFTTPKSDGDELFDTIIKKFKGKVVFVDFWATWCAPCLHGIEQMRPLKAELADKDVAFVYITNPTSPEKTYTKMIPDIKGEHFRVTADEWNYLTQKFNINGIPHYVLVNKNGKTINPNLDQMGNDELKKLLTEQMNN